LIPDNAYQQLSITYPALALLPVSWQQAIRREGFHVQAQAGKPAFECGDACQAFWMLANGAIRVFRSLGDGREIVLYYVRPGDSCVLTASGILDEQPYTASGVWDENSLAYGIDAALFRRLVAASDPFRAFVFRSFSQRFTNLLELVGAVGWKPLDARLAQLLLTKDDCIQTSHQRLANELGTVREVISRYLGAFERRGRVRLSRMRIQIRDRDGLEQIARVGE